MALAHAVARGCEHTIRSRLRVHVTWARDVRSRPRTKMTACALRVRENRQTVRVREHLSHKWAIRAHIHDRT